MGTGRLGVGRGDTDVPRRLGPAWRSTLGSLVAVNGWSASLAVCVGLAELGCGRSPADLLFLSAASEDMVVAVQEIGAGIH